jgi:hypothetical protein
LPFANGVTSAGRDPVIIALPFIWGISARAVVGGH